MNEGQLTRMLAAGNPWWRDPDWARDDRDLRRLAAAPLDYDPAPLANVEPDGLYVLRGPRRVGKSVELKREIARLLAAGVEPRRIVHFACDELARGDLQRLVRAGRDVLTRGVDGPRYWFLDEITSVPAWPEAIKWLRDNTAFGEDCVVLTGSSARDLATAQKQLAGRLGSARQPDRLLLPMGFRSFCRAIGIDDVPQLEPVRPRDFLHADVDLALIELLPWTDTLLTAWELFLRVGGFPRAVADQLRFGEVQDDFIRALWDVAAGDALRGAGTSGAQAQALLARLAKNLASPLTVSTVREEMAVDSPHTARARLQDLVFSYLVWPCHRREGDLPRLSSQAKYYFVDPLMARLAALRSPGAALEPDSSVLTEQQLGLALLRSVERERPGGYAEFSDVMYQRTSSKEVDFCGPRLGAFGFEGKYVDAGWRQEAKTVRAAFGAGVLATRGLIDTSGDVWAVPAPFVAWMLDG
ncbi:AAA family ATPase [Conexibacter sp. JD483]|uniref:ATP-binding protein n=1 Tax=unclassified Conexibacter TaxID=2627773 RepID=UPI00271997AA|nr:MULTISPECIES: AAA family ATPase [unclassified Conexibacter]MDO8187076.1 AAA family ATPase [Conexibacter sp. CPCC 205706]MDO8200934.1 AAA family ATPase [Conexibacter sp. CPCC 205762]MDR9371316.1 AAA family ATPase [Conexibacter sp. JD483]